MSKLLEKCVKQPPTKFTIHGIWPCNKTNLQPNSCIAHEPLKWEDMKCVSMIDFDNCWWNLNSDVNNINRLQLWTHEWNKHGTCSMMYPNDYCNLAFQIYKDKDHPSKQTYSTRWPKTEEKCLDVQSYVNNINRLQLWTHEWNKHGTCSSMYTKDYYNLAFKIYKSKDIKIILQNKGIQSGGLKQKKSVSMYKGIEDHIWFKPHILCKPTQNKSYLEQIIVCLDKRSSVDLVYIDCLPTAVIPLINCPSGVYFP
ncbi:ribonuclease S-4-like [Cicer arietinum]|uniref:ribonuclease S-4-like n=1 Tax=Cicer arietinum TaxID=3827 RepID=UPI000640D6E3